MSNQPISFIGIPVHLMDARSNASYCGSRAVSSSKRARENAFSAQAILLGDKTVQARGNLAVFT